MAAQMSQQSKAPQPAIIAPSREDILSNLAFFFGDPSSPEKLRDYSEHQAATCARRVLNAYSHAFPCQAFALTLLVPCQFPQTTFRVCCLLLTSAPCFHFFSPTYFPSADAFYGQSM